MDKKHGGLRAEPFFVLSALACGGCILLLAGVLALLIFLPRDAAAPDGALVPAAEASSTEADTRPIVVVDAGHGGADGGAVGVGGAVEADINQALAEQVLALLAAHEGQLRAVAAHPYGTDATPRQRAEAAAALPAQLLVSLHLNADTSPHTSGFQVFPVPPGRAHHQASLHFAQLLVEEVAATGASILGSSGVYYVYYPQHPNGSYDKQIVDAAWVDENDPPAHESFGVLQHAACPAVLAELWHITSPADMNNFGTSQGKTAMAQCVYRSICLYFELEPLVPG